MAIGEVVVTGFPAAVIILSMVAIFGIGLRSVIKSTVRGTRRMLGSEDHRDT